MEEKKSLREKMGSALSNYKSEFKKIIWPSKKELTKQTVTVILMSLLVGAIITVMDIIFSYGQRLY